MTPAEFQDLVLEQGGELSTWPERQQREARDLIASSSEAAAILAEAERLSQAILSQGGVKAPAGLKNRIFMAAFAPSADCLPVPPAMVRGRHSLAKAALRI